MTATAGLPDLPSPVDLDIPLDRGLPPEQNRLTILLRIIMAIPLLFVGILYGIAVFFAAIAAWFAALVLGEVPDGIREGLIYFLKFFNRLNCYLWLLTDKYPTFVGGDDPTYPIALHVPPKGQLNRVAVFFRIILVIPAGLIGDFIVGGLSLFAVPFWIAALILGRLPEPIYRLISVYIRFNARLYAYFTMITSEYAWGWKGDLQGTAAVSSTQFPPPPMPPPLPPTPEESAVGDATVDAQGNLPAYPTPTDDLPPVEGADSFDFVMLGWSQAWIWITLVVGLLEFVRTRRV